MTEDLSSQTEAVQTIAPGVTIQWLYDGRILIRSLSTIERDSIDVFTDFFIQHALNWPPERPFLELTDFRQTTTTPYLGKRMRDLMQVMPKNLHGRSASILPSGVIGHLMKTFLDRSVSHSLKAMEFHIFKDREMAIAWLAEALEPINPQND